MLLTRVRLTGEVELLIDGNFDDVRASFKAALASNKPWEINGPDQVVVVNPHHVLFFEPVPDGYVGDSRPSTRHHEPEPVAAQ
jgi:hypothetical protein